MIVLSSFHFWIEEEEDAYLGEGKELSTMSDQIQIQMQTTVEVQAQGRWIGHRDYEAHLCSCESHWICLGAWSIRGSGYA